MSSSEDTIRCVEASRFNCKTKNWFLATSTYLLIEIWWQCHFPKLRIEATKISSKPYMHVIIKDMPLAYLFDILTYKIVNQRENMGVKGIP